jgi:DNA-binding NarL/FixJ family response regulator
MLLAGVAGYMLKDCAFEELSLAIKMVVANEAYLSPKIANTVIQGYTHSLVNTPKSPELSAREREVLQLIAEGWKTRQIALKLSVSVKTIETHRRQIMDKLGIYSVAELTKFAVQEGITSLEI